MLVYQRVLTKSNQLDLVPPRRSGLQQHGVQVSSTKGGQGVLRDWRCSPVNHGVLCICVSLNKYIYIYIYSQVHLESLEAHFMGHFEHFPIPNILSPNPWWTTQQSVGSVYWVIHGSFTILVMFEGGFQQHLLLHCHWALGPMVQALAVPYPVRMCIVGLKIDPTTMVIERQYQNI